MLRYVSRGGQEEAGKVLRLMPSMVAYALCKGEVCVCVCVMCLLTVTVMVMVMVWVERGRER